MAMARLASSVAASPARFPARAARWSRRFAPRVAKHGGNASRIVAIASADGESPKVTNPTVKEHSGAVNEELLLLFFKLDFQNRMNKALIMDDYDLAKALQEKIDQIDEAMEKQQADKRQGGNSSSGPSMSQARVDIATEGLRLRSDLQRAIDEERYGDAAALRDALASLGSDNLAAEAAQAAADAVTYEFALGQKVDHSTAGYRGVVCGFDPVCCEGEEWAEKVGAAALPKGLQQPYYQVLVDSGEWGEHEDNVVVAYVAEELLVAPQSPLEEAPVSHPYRYLLFLGEDNEGNYIPTKVNPKPPKP